MVAGKGEKNKVNKKLTLENIANSLKSFKPLPHRFEYISGLHSNITYINDSKATTCQAVLEAIQNVPQKSYLFFRRAR